MHAIPEALTDLLAPNIVERDGHLYWTGPVDRATPRIRLADRRQVLVRRLILQHLWGREPIGPVRPACREELCVAPEHLADDVARRNTAAARLIIRSIEQAMPALLAREAQRTEQRSAVAA
jgi:hypothetical protein